jgi:hypothetical protein
MDQPQATACSPAPLPLSPAERLDFQERFERRLDKVRARTADVFAFTPGAPPPVVVNSAFYHFFGLHPGCLPAGYYDDPAVMTHFQERSYYEQVCAVDDDFVPYLMPWFGTSVAASAFGSRVEFPPGLDPAADPRYYPVRTPQDIRRLAIPDPGKDGLMPKVLAFQRYMKAHSFLPVGITDCQGPLTTANQLMGYDRLIYLMYDEPRAVHELMDKITAALVLWIKAQKAVIGERLDECIGDQQVYVGKHAGVWLSDDDAVLISEKTYRQFVVPYNARILQAFGGGIVHFCGKAAHQAQNFLDTEGLVGLNVYNLYQIPSLADLHARIAGRLVLFACDFTPVDYPAYYAELFASLKPLGLAIDSQLSPVVGLLPGGKYAEVRRERSADRRAVFDCIQQALRM